MPEIRSLLERADRAVSGMPLPPDGLEQVRRRRDRKRRGGRIRAGMVGLAIAIGTAWLGVSAIRSTPPVPRDVTPPPPANIDWERAPGVTVDGDAIVDIRTGDIGPLPASIRSFGERPTRFSVAPGGDVLLFEVGERWSRNRIYVTNVDGSNVRQLLADSPGGSSAGGWSPDGTKIVALVGGGVGRVARGNVDLVLVDVTTGETTLVATGPARRLGWGYTPAHFSADGQRILLSRYPGVSEIPVGGGAITPLFDDRHHATFSPDGRTIWYYGNKTIGNMGGIEVWLANADGSHPRPLVRDNTFSVDPSWSPDGTRIVYHRWALEEDPHVVLVVDVASGTPTFSVLAPRPATAMWLDDDTLLVDVWPR